MPPRMRQSVRCPRAEPTSQGTGVPSVSRIVGRVRALCRKTPRGISGYCRDMPDAVDWNLAATLGARVVGAGRA